MDFRVLMNVWDFYYQNYCLGHPIMRKGERERRERRKKGRREGEIITIVLQNRLPRLFLIYK